MSIVVPAILPSSKEELERELARFATVDAIDTIQIDMVDGRFASPPTWPYTEGGDALRALLGDKGIPYFERFRFDIDLMVTDPETAAPAWLSAGATYLTLHLESTSNISRVIKDMRRTYGHEPGLTSGYFSLGLAIGLETDLALLEPHLDMIDYVQLMGIAKIGRQGQPFDKRVLKYIRTLRASRPELPIQIDGAVSLATLPELIRAGATRVIVGSALKGAPDVGEKFAEFERVAHHARSEALGYTGVI